MSAVVTVEAPAAAAPSTRVRPAQALRNTLTIAWRNLVAIKHSPMELVDLSVQPLMFVLLFSYVFGGAMAGSPAAYLEFGLAGIIVQNAMFLTMNTAMGLNTDIAKGVFDRFRSLPIARSAPLAGRIAADVVRQLWSVAILLGVGYLIGFRIHTGVVETLAAVGLLLVFVVAFSWLPVLVSVLVDSPEKVQVFAFVLIFPLTFASGAFVQVATMPGWMQAWVKVNPVTSLSDALRALLVGGTAAGPVLQTLAWAAAIVAVFAPLTLRAFRRRT